MYKKFFIVLFLFAFGFAANTLYAQAEPVLYLCVEYGDYGEESISDVFTTGYLTAVVKCDYELNASDVAVQFDKFNFKTDKFEFYKKFDYTIDPKGKYFFFSKNDESDMTFEEPGFYRVYLLDENKDSKVIASTIVRIIPRSN